MTEQEWLASEDPRAMLEYVRSLGTHPRSGSLDAASDRKLRLFACGCCRQVWENLTDGSPKGNKGGTRIALSYLECWVEAGDWTAPIFHQDIADDGAGACVRAASDANAARAAENAAYYARQFSTKEQQAHLLRDIVGNPLRPVEVASYVGHWHSGLYAAGGSLFMRDWLTPTVTSMAKAIYQDRTFDDMPILGDALEEAGCDNEDILRHCRGYEWCIDDCHDEAGGSYWCSLCGGTEGGTENWMPLRGPHVRGCWVIDLLLGKE